MQRSDIHISYWTFPEEIERLRVRERTKAGPKKKRGSAPIDRVRSLYLGDQGDLYVGMRVQINGKDLLNGGIPLEAVPDLYNCLRRSMKHGSAVHSRDIYGGVGFACKVEGEIAFLTIVDHDGERRARAGIVELHRAVQTAFNDFREELLRLLPELTSNPSVGPWLVGGIDAF